MISFTIKAVIRGTILSVLYQEYPEGINVTVLKNILVCHGFRLTKKELKAFTYYLKDSGYVSISDLSVIRISVQGIQLYEKWIYDKSVIFDFD